MIDENILTKLYYTIGEVSEMFSVNDSTLRYWESEFTKLKPKKKISKSYKKDVWMEEKT